MQRRSGLFTSAGPAKSSFSSYILEQFMSISSQLTAEHGERHASLKLSQGPNGQVLTARIPLDCSEEDFLRVGRTAYGLINKLTGCNCASGRISFVVEDIYADVIRVNLKEVGVAGVR
jgi:hypothetical protein